MRLEILYSTVTANTLAQDGSQDGRDRQLFALPVYLVAWTLVVCCVEFIELYPSTSGQRRKK